MYVAIAETTLEPSLQRPTTKLMERWNAGTQEHRKFRDVFRVKGIARRPELGQG